jgi:hypothetical protein
MKKLVLFLTASLFAGASALYAQTPEPDTLRDPIKQGDPELRTLPPQAEYRKDMVIVKRNEIPAVLQKALRDPEYKGWEKATIYRNSSSTLYLVEIQEPAKTRVYRFDKNGKRTDNE